MITYFGVHIDAMLQAWFGEIFVPELRHKYGNDTEVAALVLVDTPWLSPEVQLEKMEARHLLLSSDNERVTGDEGLLENVRRKLSFVLRTEMPSSFARQRPDLVEPGDFPWLVLVPTRVTPAEFPASTRSRTGGPTNASSTSSSSYVQKLHKLQSLPAKNASRAGDTWKARVSRQNGRFSRTEARNTSPLAQSGRRGQFLSLLIL